MQTSVLLVLALAFCSLSDSQQDNYPSEELGRILGLPVDVNLDKGTEASPPPALLMDMYRCWSKRDADPESCAQFKDISYMPDVDLVRSFVGRAQDKAPAAVQSYNHQELHNSMSILFNSSFSIRQNETTQTAEVWIFRDGMSEAGLRWFEENRNCDLSSGLNVQLYSKISSNGHSDVVFFEKNVTLSRDSLTESQWVVFKNLTQLYQSWFGVDFKQSDNYSVSLRIAFAPPCSSVHPRDFGFTSAPTKEPLIFGFSKSAPEGKEDIARRGLAKLASVASARSRRSTSVYTLEQINSHRCQLYKYNVTFEELGWSDFIITPLYYEANFCGGTCDAPLSNSDNTTKHSYIQSIVNVNNPTEVPKPCCVPTELAPLQVVYKEGPETFTLQTWTEMRAVSCGCR